MPDETFSSALVLLKTVSVNVRFDGSLYALIICFPVGRPSENPGGVVWLLVFLFSQQGMDLFSFGKGFAGP